MSDTYNYQDPEVFYDDELDLPQPEAQDNYDPEAVVPKVSVQQEKEQEQQIVPTQTLEEALFSEDEASPPRPQQQTELEQPNQHYGDEVERNMQEEYNEPTNYNDINESGIAREDFSDIDDGEQIHQPIKKAKNRSGGSNIKKRSSNRKRDDSRSQEEGGEGSGNDGKNKRKSNPRKDTTKCDNLYAAFPFMKQESFSKKMADLESSADDRVARLQNEMSQAVENDLNCIGNDKPAFDKLEILPKILDFMRRKYNHRAMFEAGILQDLRAFMEPTPCGVLPDIKIQYELLTLLEELPITINMLRNSFIGRVVEFYVRTPRATKRIKDAAKELKSKWVNMATRRVMGKKMTNVDPEKVRLAKEQFKRNMPNETVQSLRKTMKRIKQENKLRY